MLNHTVFFYFLLTLRDNYQKISYILLELEEIFTISMTESAKTNMQLKLMNGFTFYQKLIFKGGLLNDVPLGSDGDFSWERFN